MGSQMGVLLRVSKHQLSNQEFIKNLRMCIATSMISINGTAKATTLKR